MKKLPEPVVQTLPRNGSNKSDQMKSLPEPIVQKLRLIALLFDDKQAAMALLAKHVALVKTAVEDKIFFRRKAAGPIAFDNLLAEQSKLHRRRHLKGYRHPLHVLQDALDLSDVKSAPSQTCPPLPSLDAQEHRRDPHGNYEAYAGDWPKDE